jgi:hypothetical protein
VEGVLSTTDECKRWMDDLRAARSWEFPCAVAGVTVVGADNRVVSVNCFLHVVDDGGARMVGMDGRALQSCISCHVFYQCTDLL